MTRADSNNEQIGVHRAVLHFPYKIRPSLDIQLGCSRKLESVTPPETNMAPKNRYLQKEFPIGNHHLKVPC